MTPFDVDPSLSSASTIPSRCYLEPGFLAAENERVFGRTWQLVGSEADVADPGRFFTTTVAGEPVLVARGADGALRALSNVCRHRAGPVASGSGSCRALRCGYHGWGYGLDGRLLGTPEFEGVGDFRKDDVALPPFRV